MKLFIGLAMSAALVCAAGTADAQVAGGKLRPVSDFDEPYFGGPPPAAIPEPEPPAPRYYDRGYYGQDRGYERGYYNQDYHGSRDYRYEPERSYAPGYGYAPSLLPPHEVYAILRENGFSPLGAPRQRGYTYVIAVLDRGGEDGRLIIDGRSGRIIRFVPASQWGQAFDRMSYQPGPFRDPGGPLPPPTVIKASPQTMQTVPSVASRAAPSRAVVSRPAPPAPVATKPAEAPQKSAAVNEARPAQPAPHTAGTIGEVKPVAPQTPATPQAPAAPQVKPSQDMPKVQGFE
jgi:hypothetical protein